MTKEEIYKLNFIINNRKYCGDYNPRDYNIFDDFRLIDKLYKVIKFNKELHKHKLKISKIKNK
jgi:hypothetical protein